MLNAALAGIGSEMRIKPLFSSWLYAVWRASNVDTSSLGQLAPSTGWNTGSRPSVELKRARRSGGVILQASREMWQLPHVRPFVPRLWKNGLDWSIPPAVL